jgi:hypothetical protein
MYTKQELDVVGTYTADTVRDEDLLCMAKYMYKEGLLKASVKYDPDTDSNMMEYRVTVVHTYRDEKDKKQNSSEEVDSKQRGDTGSVKDMNEHHGFFRRIFNS